MPSKEAIFSHIKELVPVSVASQNTIELSWSDREPGAGFTLSKIYYPEADNIPATEAYVLSVSGNMISKEKVIDNFLEALGKPIIEPEDVFGRGTISMAWNAEDVDKIIKS